MRQFATDEGTIGYRDRFAETLTRNCVAVLTRFRLGDAETRGKMIGGRLLEIKRYVEVLADSRRRRALYYLREHRTETVTVDELARAVKALETKSSPATLVEDDYEAVRQELAYDHLPRLAEFGIISYDAHFGDLRFDPSRGLLILLRVSHLVERPS